MFDFDTKRFVVYAYFDPDEPVDMLESFDDFEDALDFKQGQQDEWYDIFIEDTGKVVS